MVQLPTGRTPVAKCEHLGLYATGMFSKFPENAVLTALGVKLGQATQALAEGQRAYAEHVRRMVLVRVDVKFADYVADDGVRAFAREVERADKGKGGRIGSQVLPGGVTPIIKPVGKTQVDEMRNLEGRIDAVAGMWRDAAAEKAKLVKLRTQYEAALEARRSALQRASDLRSARDATKEDFLDLYAQVVSGVEGEYPRNRRMQDLFFDSVEGPRREEADQEVPEEGPPSGPGAPPAS